MLVEKNGKRKNVKTDGERIINMEERPSPDEYLAREVRRLALKIAENEHLATERNRIILERLTKIEERLEKIEKSTSRMWNSF